jgi:hypothetical protein
MDRLKMCMGALRLLEKLPESPNRVPLAEQRINEYLRAESATPRSSLSRLCAAIERKAEPFRGTNHFWIVVQEFVCSTESRGD